MTVYLCDHPRVYIGLNTDIKPTSGAMGETIPAGSIFKEVNTGREYVWSSTGWHIWIAVTTTSTV